VIVGAVVWPIALPQTKVVHLLRLAWVTVVVSVNQSETSQGNPVIQSGCESQLYQAYRLRIQSKATANTSQGWKQIDCGIKRIGCVSKANPKRIRQKDGNDLTAVPSVSAAYPKQIQSEHVKRMDTN
jgi:hypothetical protein